MKKRIVLALLILCGLGSAFCVKAVLAQDQVDLLWKARALQAKENIEKSVEKMKDKSQKLTPKMTFEAMLECAYSLIIADPNTVVKKSPKGTSYHLLFNYGDDGMLDVFYNYDNETNQCAFMGIDSLPKHRRIGIPVSPQFANIIFITNPSDPNEPGIAFDRSHPFSAQVVNPIEEDEDLLKKRLEEQLRKSLEELLKKSETKKQE